MTPINLTTTSKSEPTVTTSSPKSAAEEVKSALKVDQLSNKLLPSLNHTYTPSLNHPDSAPTSMPHPFLFQLKNTQSHEVQKGALKSSATLENLSPPGHLEKSDTLEPLEILDFLKDTSEVDELNLEFDLEPEIDEKDANLNEKIESLSAEANTGVHAVIDEKSEVRASTADILTHNAAIDAREEVVTTGESIAMARLQNVYRMEGIFGAKGASFAKILGNLEHAEHAFTTGNFVHVDFEAKKAFVPRTSGMPVGTEIEIEGITLTVTHMTEEEEKSLMADWHAHLRAQPPRLEEHKTEEKKEDSLEKSKMDSGGVQASSPTSQSVKSLKSDDRTSGINERVVEVINLRVLERSATARKNREKEATEEQIKKDELLRDIRNERILKDGITSAGIKENTLKIDKLKQKITRVERQFHNTMTAGHRLAIIPTIAG